MYRVCQGREESLFEVNGRNFPKTCTLLCPSVEGRNRKYLEINPYSQICLNLLFPTSSTFPFSLVDA